MIRLLNALRSGVPVLIFSISVASLIPSAAAQIVQQPSFRNFSYSGSAWVPDGGTASLASTYATGTGRVSRGWGPYSRANMGGTTGTGLMSVSVDVIDLQALDEAILNINAKPDPSDPNATSSGSIDSDSERRHLPTVPQSRKLVVTRDYNGYRRALAGHHQESSVAPSESQIESDIRFFLYEGKKAEQANRIISARVYYQMAIDAMTPEMVERYQRIMAEQKAAEEKRLEANRPDRIKF